jgi:hypothetical protein
MKTGDINGEKKFTELSFDRKADFQKIIDSVPGYSIRKMPSKAGTGVFFEGELVARCFRKDDFYEFLNEAKIVWQPELSKKFLHHNILINIVRETLFIIEDRCQQTAGWVYKKLQTCDFKRKQYLNLVSPLGLKVEYVYVLNDWFKKPEYKDILNYVHSVNCHYKFNELPLSWLGLPTRKV